MPLVKPEDMQMDRGVPLSLGYANRTPLLDDSPDFGDTMQAMINTENTLGTIINKGTVSEQPSPDEMVDYVTGRWNWEEQANKTEYVGNEDAMDHLALSKNQRDFDLSVEALRRYDADRKTIAESGMGAQLTAGLIAGILDPVQLPLYAIPALKAATMARTMASVGAGGFLGATLEEGALHPLQPTRTLEESANNIGLSTMFGIGLGGTAYGISRAMGLSVMPKEDLTPEITAAIDDHLASPMDAGAAAVIDPQFNNPARVKDINARIEAGEITKAEGAIELRAHQLEWTGTKFPKITRALARISPHVRVATSPFISARVINEGLTEGTLVRGKNDLGVTQGYAVETMINMKRDTLLANSYDMVGKAWREHTGLGEGKLFATLRGNKMAKKSDDILDLEDFSTEIGRAIVAGGKHDNPAIANVAKQLKKEILEPFEKELVDIGLIGHEEIRKKNSGELIKEMYDEDGSYIYVYDKRGQDGKYREVPFDQVERRKVANPPVGDKWFYPRMWNFDKLKTNQLEFSEIMMKEMAGEIRKAHKRDAWKLRGGVDHDIRKELGIETSDLTGKKVAIQFAENEISMDPKWTVWNEKGNITGTFKHVLEGDNIYVTTKVQKGYTEKAILEMASRHPDKQVHSRGKLTQKDVMAWNRMVKKGNAQKNSDGSYSVIRKPKYSEEYIRLRVEKELDRRVKLEVADEISEIRENMGDFIRNIISTPTGFVPKDMAFKGSHLMERTLKIQTEKIQDFLIQDVRYVMHGYLDSMTPRLEMAKKYDGEFDMKHEFAKIEDEYELLVKDMPDGKEKNRLSREKNDSISDLLGMRDILLRNFKRPDDPSSIFNLVGRRLREANYVAKLGGMTAAAIPDVANIVMRNGFKRLGKQLKVALPHPKDFIDRRQAKIVGASLDYQLQGRAESMLMIDENYGHVSRLDTNINKGVRQFGNITGMTYWNTFWKGVASGAYMDEVGAVITRQGMTPETKKWFAQHQIAAELLPEIKRQWKKHGTIEEGLRVPNTDKWTNQYAREAMETSILKEANTSIVTPGAGDLPLVARHVVGKLWLQFSTFPMSATTRLMMPMIQSFDQQKAAGAVTMVLLGMMSYSIKEIAAGREPSTDLGTLVREGLDRSGVLGMWGNINAITEKLSAGHLGLQPLIGGDNMTKYRARSVVNDLMGPSMGTFKDVIRVTNAIFNALADGEVSSGDINAVRRLLPYQNLIFTRRLFDEVAKILGEKADE